MSSSPSFFTIISKKHLLTEFKFLNLRSTSNLSAVITESHIFTLNLTTKVFMAFSVYKYTNKTTFYYDISYNILPTLQHVELNKQLYVHNVHYQLRKKMKLYYNENYNLKYSFS